MAEDAKHNGERRIFPRYAIVGTAEVWEDGYTFSTRGTVTDISMSGCYVQMLNPMTTGQKLRFKLTLGKTVFEGDAVVVNHHPSLGMGIDFEHLTADQQRQLNACIQYAMERQAGHASSGNDEKAATTDEALSSRASTLLNKMQEWFHDHDLMTRDEFRKMLERAGAEDKDKFIL